jgi:hypothetical protein
MTADDLLVALDLPAATRVDQRVPKKLFLENGAPTAADRWAITKGVEECRWVAALKQHTIGVTEYHDADRSYIEIHVLRLTVMTGASKNRLIELIHRAIPYPLFLVHEQGSLLGLSMAHKRHSLGEAGKSVLDTPPFVVEFEEKRLAAFVPEFCAAIAIGLQPGISMYHVYTGWIDALLALLAAGRIGRFQICDTRAAADSRKIALRECQTLDAEITRIHAAAARETQLSRISYLNQALSSARARLAAAEARL